ncbi:MAG: L-dopachrome tautomerase-related protein [Pseudomonadota bacterium]
MVRWLFGGLVFVLALAVVALRVFYGGGEPYPDLSTEPRFGPDALERVVVSDRPIGNVAVSDTGRVFYTIHPESNPVGPKLYEWVDGAAEPWPSPDQDAFFAGPLGLVVDQQGRLWVIDPARHGSGQPRLIAFDLETGSVVSDHDFAREIAPLGSFLQDLQIDGAGETIYIADVGFMNRQSALIVYDVKTQTARRVLAGHASVQPQPWLIQTPSRTMSYFGGLVSLRPGVDGIALSRDGDWLYYAAMAHDTLYRLPTAALKDDDLAPSALEAAIEAVTEKPLNDGLSADDQGNIYLTDVEHQGVMRITPKGVRETLIKDPRIRWADALSFGPDGWLYVADSALPLVILKPQSAISKAAPFHIYRFKPEATGYPGQ